MQEVFNAETAIQEREVRKSRAVSTRKEEASSTKIDFEKMFGYQNLFHIDPEDVPEGMQAGYASTHIYGEPNTKAFNDCMRKGWRPAQPDEMPKYEKEFMGMKLIVRSLDVAEAEKEYQNKRLEENIDLVQSFTTKANVGPLSRNIIDLAHTNRSGLGFGSTRHSR